jgi:hypothetical protein
MIFCSHSHILYFLFLAGIITVTQIHAEQPLSRLNRETPFPMEHSQSHRKLIHLLGHFPFFWPTAAPGSNIGCSLVVALPGFPRASQLTSLPFNFLPSVQREKKVLH